MTDLWQISIFKSFVVFEVLLGLKGGSHLSMDFRKLYSPNLWIYRFFWKIGFYDSICLILTIFTPSDPNSCRGSISVLRFPPFRVKTPFLKHFIGRANNYHRANITNDNNFSGYFNTTSAINAIQFKFSSGNIGSGIIKLYGIKDS